MMSTQVCVPGMRIGCAEPVVPAWSPRLQSGTAGPKPRLLSLDQSLCSEQLSVSKSNRNIEEPSVSISTSSPTGIMLTHMLSFGPKALHKGIRQCGCGGTVSSKEIPLVG